ncbi:MAG: tRNA preQ1(34) S-adenosylmethionine ribosyltransferase-isomerase QueA [Rhodospirillaceae bacterium]
MKVDLFDFDLPQSCIATRPIEPRDAARLLEVPDTGEVVDRTVQALPDLLQPGDVAVFNDTRVIPAQLSGRIGEGGVEVTLHLRVDDWRWWVFAKPGRKLQPGRRVQFAPDLAAEVERKDEDGSALLRFETGHPQGLTGALEDHGRMPLPPYMKRAADQKDRTDYQTVYARDPGAVAAPTAGLHFTDRVLAALDARGVHRVHVTLHVGAGTFLPVKVDDTQDHRMHAERGVVSPEAVAQIEAARAAGGKVIAVGTTALRLLESAAQPDGSLAPFDEATRLFITPGYQFRITGSRKAALAGKGPRKASRNIWKPNISAWAGFKRWKKQAAW